MAKTQFIMNSTFIPIYKYSQKSKQISLEQSRRFVLFLQNVSPPDTVTDTVPRFIPKFLLRLHSAPVPPSILQTPCLNSCTVWIKRWPKTRNGYKCGHCTAPCIDHFHVKKYAAKNSEHKHNFLSHIIEYKGYLKQPKN